MKKRKRQSSITSEWLTAVAKEGAKSDEPDIMASRPSGKSLYKVRTHTSGKATRPAMRRFYLQRNRDVSGLSGTGIVAEGVVFTNGWVAMTWLTPLQSHAFYHSIDVLGRIHGHEGATSIVFIDDPSD